MPDQLEADLTSEYGMDLEAVLRDGTPSPRRVSVLARGLPPGSRIWQALGGPSARSDEGQYLVHLMHQLSVMWWAYSGGQGARPAEPKDPVGWLAEKERKASKARQFAEKQQRWKAATHSPEQRAALAASAAAFRAAKQ